MFNFKSWRCKLKLIMIFWKWHHVMKLKKKIKDGSVVWARKSTVHPSRPAHWCVIIDTWDNLVLSCVSYYCLTLHFDALNFKIAGIPFFACNESYRQCADRMNTRTTAFLTLLQSIAIFLRFILASLISFILNIWTKRYKKLQRKDSLFLRGKSWL